MEVASPKGWIKNKALVLEFYNQRRRQLLEVQPNTAHLGLVELENHFDVQIITQNVDDLHERAGSTKVLHLHGELFKVRSTCNASDVRIWKKDLNLGDTDRNACQLRPHIVWFGEAVPMLDKAVKLVEQAEIFVVIGTSMQVYPAASLIHYLPSGNPIYFIDPRPTISKLAFSNLTVINKTATKGVKVLQNILYKAQ
jgi:NAD-dependent deacetylase